MNIQERKIRLAQSLLRLEDEQIIESLEKLLRQLKVRSMEQDFKPMTVEELNERVQKSEEDYENGRVITAQELLKKYE